MDYNGNTVVIVSIGLNIILGGLGFLTLTELFSNKTFKLKKLWKALTIHSRLVLIVTAILIFSGMLLFLVIEYNGILKTMPLKKNC